MAHEINLGRVKGRDGTGFFALNSDAYTTAQLLAQIPEIKVNDFIINSFDTNCNWGGIIVAPGTVVCVTELAQNLAEPWQHEPRGAIRGVQGIAGTAPDHEWNGTAIRFQHPDKRWGEWIDVGNGNCYPNSVTDTKSLKLENSRAEFDFIFDTAFIAFMRPWIDNDETLVKELDEASLEEKIYLIIFFATSVFQELGFDNSWWNRYISEDFEVEESQQLLNFFAPLIQIMFKRMQQVTFARNLHGYKTINFQQFAGSLHFMGDTWSELKLDLNGNNLTSNVFMRPSGRPDLQWQSFNINGQSLYDIDIKLTQGNSWPQNIIIEGRARIDNSNNEIMDISGVVQGITNWQSYIELNSGGNPFIVKYTNTSNSF